MISNDINSKKRIAFVDNVSSVFAIEQSINYPNAIFFTNEGDIYKDGQVYTRILGVDPLHNSINIGETSYSLIINDKRLLQFVENKKWLFYIGPDIQTKDTVHIVTNENEPGWRLITENQTIINNENEITNINDNPFKFNPTNMIDDYNNPLFYTIKLNNSNIDSEIKEKYNNQVNQSIQSDNIMYIYLPKQLVDLYHVGIYDVYNETNFLEESNLIIKDDRDDANNQFNGIDYYCYRLNTTLDEFSLGIYAKQ